MNQPGTLVISHSKLVIAVTLAITAALATVLLIRGLQFDGSPDTLSRNDEALRFYNDFKSSFGDDRVIIIGITTSEVFSRVFIEKLDRLTSRLDNVPGVAETVSLANLKVIERKEDGVYVNRLLPSPRDSGPSTSLAALKERVIRDPLYRRHYISPDGRSTAVTVFLDQLPAREVRRLADEVATIARSEAPGDDVFLAGVPVMDARGVESMVRDILVCSPIAALLCFLIFLVTFRSLMGAVLPLASLIIGLISTLGIMSLAGRPVTYATLSLPTVLMAVGSSYVFHIINQYRISLGPMNNAAGSIRHRWSEGFKFIRPAVVVSGTTTMVGFGALASSRVPTVRDMGLFESIGVLVMLLLAITFVPACLSMLPVNSFGTANNRRADYAGWLTGPLRQVTALLLFRRRAILVGFLAVAGLAGAAATMLRVNTDYLRIFPSSSDTVQAALKMHERLAGAATVQVVLEGREGAALDPAFIRTVDSLKEFAVTQPGVDAAVSIADVIKRIHGLTTAGTGDERLPESGPQLESIFRDFLSDEPSLSRLVSQDHSRAVVLLRTNLFSSRELKQLTHRIAEWGRASLPAGLSVQSTGAFVLLNDASDAVAAAQLSGLAIALASIFLMMAGLFRSITTAALALIPNLLPIIGFFGFLGLAGIDLDITTSLIATAVLGLAVDNSVHMIRRYRQCISQQADSAEAEGWAWWMTMSLTGKPMVLANLMLIAAFLVFTVSSFAPVRVGGILWALALLACLLADILFLPALMRSSPFKALFTHRTVGHAHSNSGKRRWMNRGVTEDILTATRSGEQLER